MKHIEYAELESLVGQELFSDWIEVNQNRIDQFANATDDHQWIHTDVARAEREQGGTIAHGFLTLSLLSALLAKTLVIDSVVRSFNYGLNKVRFIEPVPSGACLRLRDRIRSVTARNGGKLLLHDCEIDAQQLSRPVLVAEWLTLHHDR